MKGTRTVLRREGGSNPSDLADNSPYKQKIGQEILRTDIKKSNCGLYSGFSQIAFFTNQWMKIQDSLEMIFNLLTGNSTTSLEILAYLRRNKNTASPCAFARYLSINHNMVLINRRNEKGISQVSQIKKLLRTIRGKNNNVSINILFIGDSQIHKDFGIHKSGYVIHPSGYNLNNNPELYSKVWFEFQDTAIKTNINHIKKPRFSIFHVLGKTLTSSKKKSFIRN